MRDKNIAPTLVLSTALLAMGPTVGSVQARQAQDTAASAEKPPWVEAAPADVEWLPPELAEHEREAAAEEARA